MDTPSPALQSPHLVLIDDDPLVHQMWQWLAHRQGHHLVTYANAQAFWANPPPKDTPIYVDMDLGPGPSGLDLIKDLSKQGFTKTFLCTGYTAQDLGPQAKGVIVCSKDYPLS